MNRKTTPRLGALLVAVMIAGGACGGGSKTAGPGPSKVMAGVPVGYAHSKAGAVAAAMTYTRALAQTIGKGAEARQRVLSVISVPERRDDVLGGQTAALDKLEATLVGRGSFSRLGVLGQEVSSYSGDVTKIVLWTVAVVGVAGTQGQASWGAGDVELRWRKGDWKLWSTSSRSTPDVAPALVGQPAAADKFAQAVQGFKEVDDVAAQ